MLAEDRPAEMDDKFDLTPIARLRAPLGGQEIDLQQLDWAVGGLSLLRVRIREGRRFTVFDIDAATAAAWGEAMQLWAGRQPAPDETTKASGS